MNFWTFLTRPGDIIKHDEEISNCSSAPQAGPSSDSAVSLVTF